MHRCTEVCVCVCPIGLGGSHRGAYRPAGRGAAVLSERRLEVYDRTGMLLLHVRLTHTHTHTHRDALQHGQVSCATCVEICARRWWLAVMRASVVCVCVYVCICMYVCVCVCVCVNRVKPSIVQHIGTHSSLFSPGNKTGNPRFHLSRDFPTRIRYPGACLTRVHTHKRCLRAAHLANDHP